MWRYIAQRLLWLLVIMVCVAMVIFTIMWFVPGDPAQIMLGSGATAQDIADMRAILGLDKPFITQLGNYLRDLLHLDFGTSYTYKVPVISEFAQRLPRTLLLGLISIALNVVIGIPLGITAATHRNTFRDQGLLVSAMVFISVPQFFLAQMVGCRLSGSIPGNAGSCRSWRVPCPVLLRLPDRPAPPCWKQFVPTS